MTFLPSVMTICNSLWVMTKTALTIREGYLQCAVAADPTRPSSFECAHNIAVTTDYRSAIGPEQSALDAYQRRE
jgi:hypothetical protein